MLGFLRKKAAPIAAPLVSSTGKPPRFPITRNEIARQVHIFYAYVQADRELSDVLNRYIEDWNAHEKKLRAFWAKVLLHEPGYEGAMNRAHDGVAELSPDLLERWLEHFHDAAHEVLPADSADEWVRIARQLGKSVMANVPTSVRGAEI